jgi:putative protease
VETRRGIRVLAPCSDPREVGMLVESGADELYTGLVPREWLERFGPGLEVNRRDPRTASVGDEGSLRELVREAHERSVPVYLALNAHAFAPEQHGLLLDLVKRAVLDVAVDALIVADVGLLALLAEERERGADYALRARIHASSLAVARNAASVRFFSRLGASRVILPRHVTLEEVAAIGRACPGVELEAFVLNDGCAYEEGTCHTVHGVGSDRAFCMRDWDVTLHARAPGGGAFAPTPAGALRDHLDHYRLWLWYLSSCGLSQSQNGLPQGPCGLCAIPALERAGVVSLKVVGRQASPYRKLKSVQLVSAVAKRLARGAGEADVKAFARTLRAPTTHCDSGLMCYYRDAWDGPMPGTKLERRTLPRSLPIFEVRA